MNAIYLLFSFELWWVYADVNIALPLENRSCYFLLNYGVHADCQVAKAIVVLACYFLLDYGGNDKVGSY